MQGLTDALNAAVDDLDKFNAMIEAFQNVGLNPIIDYEMVETYDDSQSANSGILQKIRVPKVTGFQVTNA